MVEPKAEALRAKIRETLKHHEAYTRIVYTDTDSRTSYECVCGSREVDTDLLGSDWLATHRTNEVVKVISASGVKL